MHVRFPYESEKFFLCKCQGFEQGFKRDFILLKYFINLDGLNNSVRK